MSSTPASTKPAQAVSVCLVGELPPPTGGMAVQAERLGLGLAAEGHLVRHVRTNALSPQSPWRRVKGLRGVVNLLAFLATLVWTLPRCRVVHIFSNSFLSFWLFTAPPALLGRLLGKRVVIHYHGGSADEFLGRWQALAAPILRCGHSILVPSGFLVEIFGRFGFTAHELPNIMPLDRFTFRLRSPLRPTVLMARHLQALYNPACGLRAFALLAKSHPEARLTIAGDGPERPALDALAAQLGVTGQVTFLGNIGNERMLQQLQQHDILLNTSRVDNQPVSLLEAFACGLPVVSTAVGGIVHMIDHGVDGLLAPSDDALALAAQMRRLLDDPALAIRIAEAAHAKVQGHDWRQVYPRLAKAYTTKVQA